VAKSKTKLPTKPVKAIVQTGAQIPGVQVTVVLDHQPKKEPALSWQSMILGIVGVVVLGSVFASTAYGVATGDYSALKLIATCGVDVVSKLLAKKPE